MRAVRIAAAIACVPALCLALAACGGAVDGDGETNLAASAGEARAAVSYTPDQVTVGDFEIKIASATVEWDEAEERDALVLTLEATNAGSDVQALGDVLNLADVAQGGVDLDWAYDLADVEDGYSTITAAGTGENLAPGESGTYTYAYLLEGYDDPVVVHFQGYSSGVEGDEKVSFDVAGCRSAESMTAEQSASEEAAAREAEVAGGEKSATLQGVSIDLPDGWYFPYTSSYSATAENVAEGRVYLATDSQRTDAASWAEETGAKFSSHALEDTTLAGRPAKLLQISDDVWYAYLDTGAGTGALEVQANDVTLDEAAEVFDAMSFG